MYMLRASFIVLQHAALLSEVVACVESFVAGSDAEMNAALAAKREASVRTIHALSPVCPCVSIPHSAIILSMKSREV